MREIIGRLTGAGRLDHRAVFHTFAEGLARALRRRRPTARVRAVEI